MSYTVMEWMLSATCPIFQKSKLTPIFSEYP